MRAMNDADRWQQAKALFFDALEQPADGRSAFVETACANDPALLAQVQALLLADGENKDGVLDAPPLGFSLGSVDDPDVNRSIGPYRIVRLLGRGGMGNVYLAEREDGTFQQTVAIKLIRRGLDTDDILSRFRYERQILASLEHPNIARLLDGGVTDDGRPYFVMEYVDGVPLTEYCDAHRLSTPQRLALFRTVCRAVQYAHQNLVIHRDLKPSNMLVTEDGSVKLLDFGIAKLLSEEGLEQTTPQTQKGLRMMTPEYAAPEQVRGEAITTSTDVYQLGVLLYEMLTGRRPYQLQARVKRAIEQAILEEEPTRPSTAVREAATTEEEAAETISTARATRPADLARQLSGDLDTICLTALQKDPGRRYGSVGQFSEDLRRHMSGLPVTARTDSAFYRVGKFVRRHRMAVIASALALVVALGGGVLYTVRIQAERDRTAQALRQSESALDFLKNMILAGDPIDGDPDTPIGVVLDSASARIDVALADEPEVARTVHAALGYVYLSLDKVEQGEQHLLQAHELRSDETSEENVARNLLNLATLLGNQGRYEEAVEHNQEALRLLRTLDVAAIDMATALDNYGTLLSNSGREADAIPLHEEALHLYQTSNHPDSAIALNNLAVAYFHTGSPERAMQTQRRAVAAHTQNQDPPVRIGIALSVLASLYGSAGEPDSAIVTQNRAVGLLSEALGDQHLETITARISLALLHYRGESLGLALEAAQPALHDALEALGPDSPYTAYAQEVTGAIQCDGGQPEEGAVLVRQAYNTRSGFLPEGHTLLINGLSLLGGCLTKAGQYEEAEPLILEAHQQLLETLGPDHAMTQRAQNRLRSLYEATGRMEEASQLGDEE